MDGEDLTIAPVEQEAAIEPEATEPQIVDEPQRVPDFDEEAGGETAQETAEEIEEVEIDWDDGKKYRIPKALESGILKNKDYTTKTQETAALKKALEADRTALEERSKATDEELDARADLRAIEKQLAEYAKLTPEDWNAHELQDPLGTRQHERMYQYLQNQKTELEGKIGQASKQRTEEAQQGLAKRVQETHAFVEKLPGASKETVSELIDAAYARGIPEEVVKSNWSPIFAELLFDARIGAMARQKQAAAPKLPAANLQPLAKVTGKTTPAAHTDLATADMEAYVAARRKGVGGKALR